MQYKYFQEVPSPLVETAFSSNGNREYDLNF